MKSLSILVISFLLATFSYGQEKYITKQGVTSFYSHSSIEDIKAENKQVLSIIDTSTGAIAISILMKSFMFEKSLMQEHFNENYVESDKFPKAIFKGEIIDFKEIGQNEQTVIINGSLTIHGVTKNIKTEATLIKTEENIALKGSFHIEVANFNIDIPSVVINNIAKSIKITFELDHKPYKK